MNDADADMKLPPGYTCIDCANFRRWCKPVIGVIGDETVCDYAPSEFRLIPPPRPAPVAAEPAAKGNQ